MSELQLLQNGPADASRVLVLAHGAGAPMDSPFMDAMAGLLGEGGVRVVRFEFPYMAGRRRDQKRRGPDRPPVLEACWRAVLAGLGDGPPPYIGGKSMGGRVASLIADDVAVRGLICLGYPFHPPGRPEKLRVAHLQSLRTPTLVVQGTRDELGRRDEVAQYALSPAIELCWLEDGDHSFKPRKKSGRTEAQALAEAARACIRFMERVDTAAAGSAPG